MRLSCFLQLFFLHDETGTDFRSPLQCRPCLSVYISLIVTYLFSRSPTPKPGHYIYESLGCQYHLLNFLELLSYNYIDLHLNHQIVIIYVNGSIVKFAWKDVDVYGFPLGDGVDLKAILWFRYCKGMKYDDSKYKEIILSTRPMHLANQDSLRQL